jgi:nitrilase
MIKRIAAVQQSPVIYDLKGCLERATEIVERAASEGIEMLVFPEAWFPGYPDHAWVLSATNDIAAINTLHVRLFRNSVDLSRDGLAPLREAARKHGIVIVACINERASNQSASTIYNTAVTIDADGQILNVHRKCMPTNVERTVWGFGDGQGVRVVDTAVGRVGVLLCWENLMPLARAAIYAQNVEIYCAPAADPGESWLASMQHIAREGGAWVIGVDPTIEDDDFPADFPARDKIAPGKGNWLHPGNGIICSPSGLVVAGPMRRQKGFLSADIDLEEVQIARRVFDVVGHYSRPDIYQLTVDKSAKLPVTFTGIRPQDKAE